MQKITNRQYKYFDDIKHIDETGMEYWYARELAVNLFRISQTTEKLKKSKKKNKAEANHIHYEVGVR